MEPDQLYTLRNLFWLGHFQSTINEGSRLNRLNDNLRIERDCFIYRAYIALGQYQIVLDEIQENVDTPPALRGVKLLASYLKQVDNREIALMTLREWMNDASSANNPTLQLIGSIIFSHEDNLKEALQAIRHGTTMEQLALTVQIFLRMDRPDLAEKQVKLMQQADDDCSLTQLAGAWLNLHLGGPKYQEAAYTFQELGDKFGASGLLLNGRAAANMAMGQYEEAERVLIDAAGGSTNDPDMLVNLIACARQLNKPDDFVNRYIRQLKSAAPTHPWVQSADAMESCFDRVAAANASVQ